MTDEYTIGTKKIWFWQRTRRELRVARQGYPVTFACLGETPYRFAVCHRSVVTKRGQHKETSKWTVINLSTGGTSGSVRATTRKAAMEETAELIWSHISERSETIASNAAKLLTLPMAPEVTASIERRGKAFYVWWDCVQGPFDSLEAAQCALKIVKAV